ncbi:MAG: NAD(+) diphosphatase, partial [Actinocrinis sp.]
MADHRDAAIGPLGRLALARGAVDRTAELRVDELALAAAWSNPDTRVLVVSEGRAFVLDEPDPVLPGATRPRLVTLPSYDAPEGDRYLLGRDESGYTFFAVPAETLPG